MSSIPDRIPSYRLAGVFALFTLALVTACTLRPASAQLFKERGQAAGLGGAIHTNGVAVADFDGDGFLDLYVTAVKQHDPADPDTWNRLFRNQGDGTFSDVTDVAGVRAASVQGLRPQHMGNRFGASWGDYDGDGHPDLLLTNVGPEILYRNNGDGTFTDVSDSARINEGVSDPDTTESSGASWWDYDSDGDLDVYVNDWNGPNRLHQNQGDGTFIEMADQLGVADSGRTWTSMPVDINADGRRDLYVANDFGENRLFVAQADGSFENETFEYRMGDGGNGMGVALADINLDGRLDIYVSNVGDSAFPNVLYLDPGTPPFEEVAAFLGIDNAQWAWGTEFFDADLDGDLDLYVVNGFVLENDTPNRYWEGGFTGTGVPTFTDRTADSGADDRAEARGLVVFDYDNDGDLDMAVTTWGDRLRLFENQTTTGNWLSIRLVGSSQNPNAVGATVTLSAARRQQVRSNDGVDIFGQSITPLHFGLGTALVAETVSVKWPSGAVQQYVGIEANQQIVLTEQTPTAIEDFPARGFEVESFPNPATRTLTLRGPAIYATGPVLITDVLGRRTLARVISRTQSELTMDVSRLAPGLYNVRSVPVNTTPFSAVFLKR